MATTDRRPVEAQLEELFGAEPEPRVAARIDLLVRGRLASAASSQSHQRQRRRRVYGAAAAFAVVILAAAALVVFNRPRADPTTVAGLPSAVTSSPSVATQSPTSAPVATVVVREQNAFPLDDSPAAAAAFPGNSLIARGRISSIGAAAWTSSDHDTGHIYTPVNLEIEDVLRGSGPSGSVLTVQSLGGTVGELTMRFDDSADLAALPVGTELVVFMAAPEPGAFQPAAPNMVYRVDDRVASSLARPEERIAVNDLAELVRVTPLASPAR